MRFSPSFIHLKNELCFFNEDSQTALKAQTLSPRLTRLSVSPPGWQISLELLTDCARGSAGFFAGQSFICQSSRYEYEWVCVWFYLESLQQRLDIIYIAMAGDRENVPQQFIKNTDLAEQAHSGWMSLYVRIHIHTHNAYWIFCCQDSFSNGK